MKDNSAYTFALPIALLLVFGGEYGFVIAVIGFIVALVCIAAGQVNRAAKTGNYKECYNTKRIREYSMEKVRLVNRVHDIMREEGNRGDYGMHPAYVAGMKELDEKYAQPGSEAYKDIKEKEKRWDSGERW